MATPWKTLPSLPEARYLPSLVAVGRDVLLVGGDDAAGTFYPAVYKTRLEANGDMVRLWASAGPDLPRDCRGQACVADGRRVFVVGGENLGVDQADLSGTLTIYRADIDPDGSYRAWVPVAPLPVPLTGAGVAVAQGHLWVLGGQQVGIFLDYLTPFGTFAVGSTVTGETSGATAVITADSAGTLTLADNVGDFQNGEVIYDSSGTAAALVNGAESAVEIFKYKALSGTLPVGTALIGATSGATATSSMVQATTGTTGRFVVPAIVGGPLVDSEILLDATAADGLVNGAVTTVQILKYKALNGAAPTPPLAVRGVTSGATATIIQTEALTGTTGYHVLDAVVGGPISDDEAIVDAAAGDGLVNGAVVAVQVLKYKNRVGAFTVGQVVTGAGGANGTILQIEVLGGNAGYLIIDVVAAGPFIADEAITDPVTGSATVDVPNVAGVRFDYDAQTINFTLDAVVRDATSGAFGTLRADDDGGATGTVALDTVTGTFANNDVLTDGAGVSRADGVIAAGKQFAYDAQTISFSIGDTVKDATSGATGILRADLDGGATGTMALASVTGTFANNDVLTNGGGYAKVDGAAVVGTSFAFDTQTANFTVGRLLVNSTLLATGIIRAMTDAGATGTLALEAPSGAFANNDVLTDAAGATADGVDYITDADVDDVYRARIASDGSLGPWVNMGVLPSAFVNGVQGCVVGTDRWLHVLAAGTLYSARVDVNATQLSWVSTPTGLDRVLQFHRLVALDDNLFALGGRNAAAAVLGQVAVGRLEADGGPAAGVWRQVAPMPAAREDFGACVIEASSGVQSRIVVGGGYNAAAKAEVYTVRVDSDGNPIG